MISVENEFYKKLCVNWKWRKTCVKDGLGDGKL